jgi:hypothetical protein
VCAAYWRGVSSRCNKFLPTDRTAIAICLNILFLFAAMMCLI